ncbi:MAG: TasA family protein [Actinomycetota bacterium]
MSTDLINEEPRRERRRLLVGLLALGVTGAGLTSAVTGAIFTDTATIASNTFTTGTVDIDAAPATSAISLANMAPGDVVTAPITVTNAGTLAHRYAVTSTSDAPDANFLAAQLQMSIKSGVTTCSNAGFSGSGAAVYTAGVLGSTTGTNVIGNPTQGSQAGDRTLAAGASEVLCVQVTLPLSTGNAYQNKTTTAVFTFNAEQTANNP